MTGTSDTLISRTKEGSAEKFTKKSTGRVEVRAAETGVIGTGQ